MTEEINENEIAESTEAQAEAEAKQEEQSRLEDTIAEIKRGYEEKLAKAKAEADKAIKDRDQVITQLLQGEGTATEAKQSIADKINAKRNYRKW